MLRLRCKIFVREFRGPQAGNQAGKPRKRDCLHSRAVAEKKNFRSIGGQGHLPLQSHYKWIPSADVATTVIKSVSASEWTDLSSSDK